MKRRGFAAILFLSILMMFLLISCSSDVSSDPVESTAPSASIPVTSTDIRLEPVSSDYYDQMKNYGVPREDEESAEKFLFRYRCEKIPESVDAWIEIYENGKLIDTLEQKNTDNHSTTGIIYLLARGKENPQWTLGVIDENGTTRYGHSSGSKKELIKNSFQKMNAILLEKEAMIAPDTESLLMALLYDNQKGTPDVSLTELQHDAAPVKQAGLGILLKCSVSSE